MTVSSRSKIGGQKSGSYLVEQIKKMLAVRQTKLSLKSISVIARGLSEEPAEKAEYQDVWENGDVEIEDLNLQPA